jgi:ABC-type transport system involved in multi-copper enzyme maturation permease subunit
MTTLTVPAEPGQDEGLRPVPWRRMAWVTWRQHRIALAGVAALLGALAVWLWIAGLQLHHAYAAAIACHPASSIACGDLVFSFNGMDGILAGGFILQAVPALIGAFAGAPILAREMETGTFRYAWTQGFGRWRWTLAKLVPLAVVVAAAAAAFSVLLSWYYQPYLATGNRNLSLTSWSPLSGGLFDLRGVAFAAWTLAAFAIGTFAGMLIRRVVPAIVTSLAAYAGLATAAGLFLRQHYLTPLISTNVVNPPASAWIVSQWWTKGGTFAFVGDSRADGMPPMNFIQQVCSHVAPGAGSSKPSPGTFMQCFNQHGYTLLTSYQPATRFWPFQWIEGGWLLALSVLLIAATVWLVRRRAA